MNEQILEKEKMDSIKALSDVNIKISEAKNLLFKLEEEETEYLIKREEKALAKIEKALADSKDLIDKTYQNYEEIHEFCRNVFDYAEFLSNAHEKFKELQKIFDKRNEIWEQNARKQDEELARQKAIIKQDASAIEAREKRIIEEKESLRKEKEHIESQQATLLKSYEIEKELWNKLKKN